MYSKKRDQGGPLYFFLNFNSVYKLIKADGDRRSRLHSKFMTYDQGVFVAQLSKCHLLRLMMPDEKEQIIKL